MMHRFPDGINRPGFHQKEIGGPFPAWIHRVIVPKVGGKVTHVVCDDAATLVYLADQACAPVAAPLTWEEVASNRLTPQKYTLRNVFRLLKKRPDPWAGMFRQARALSEPARRLQKVIT